MARKGKALRFRMFGRFSVFSGGEELKLDKSGTTKAMQMLAMLIYYREGIDRETLLRNLYGEKELADRSNNMRVTVFKLRQLLTKAGLPGKDWIVMRKDSYLWKPTVPVSCDVWEFRECLAAAEKARTGGNEGKEIDERRKACGLYIDEFLRTISYEEWVVPEAIPLKRDYTACLRRLCALLNGRQEYREIIDLCTVAEGIYPYDDWQLVRIDALMALNQYDEALTVYQNYAERCFEELGISPTEEMEERYQKITEEMEGRTRSADEIYGGLVEKTEEDGGAVYVSYSSFIDRFRFLQRISERSGESNFLVVANIASKTGKSIGPDARVEEYIKETLHRTLRRSDTFTRYNASQYLLLLVGIDQESIRVVTRRINDRMAAEANGWKLTCKYRALPMRQPESDVRELGWDFREIAPEESNS